MNHRAIMPALALLLTACGQAPTVLQPTDELADATAEAAEIWRPTLESCGRSFSFGIRDVDAFVAYGDPGPRYAFTTYDRPHQITVNRDMLGTDHHLLVETLAHELGHVLGAEHTDDPADLMYPSPSPEKTGRPTAADATQVCR